MNKREATIIAETITNQEIAEMFIAAKNNISDWDAVSSVNPGMSKGTAWNILAANFDINYKYNPIAIKNMVWEFGDYLPNRLKPIKTPKEKIEVRAKQVPKFDNPLFQ
jgi:hypothetical protein